MRNPLPLFVIGALLVSCGKGSEQARALDRAAGQSDPAAAAELSKQADRIRDGGASGELSAPGSQAQNALASAGNAAAANPGAAAGPDRKPVDTQTGLTR